jgi:hypothetical protein
VARIVAGLEQVHRVGRVRGAITSAVRWLRHARSPEERRYHAHLFRAASGWQGRSGDIEVRISKGFESLRSHAHGAESEGVVETDANGESTRPQSVALIPDCDPADHRLGPAHGGAASDRCFADAMLLEKGKTS